MTAQVDRRAKPGVASGGRWQWSARAALVGVAASALVLGSGLASPTSATPASTTTSAATGQEITELIVAYEPGVTPSEGPGVATGDAAVTSATLETGDAIGFGLRTVALSEPVDEATAELIADELSQAPGVRYAEPNGIVTLADTQSTPTWGLDRVDERDLPVDSAYAYGSTGADVTAYVIDTGLRSTHAEFTGRVGAGYVVPGVGGNTDDLNGHGTHVAGTIAGTLYGVAKGVTIVPVRVFDSSNLTSTSNVITGVNWVAGNHQTGTPAVANMSLTVTPVSQGLTDAVNALINDGVTVVVASGNANGADSCIYSPGNVPAAITVNASTSADQRASFSNYGSCSDIYAPGASITSAGIASDTATSVLSGTSMASPHVAGAAARILSLNPTLTPTQVWDAILAASSVPASALTTPLISPNRLLYLPTPPTAPQVATPVTGDESITVSWTAPQTTGGSAITSYTARAWSTSSSGTQAGSCQPSSLSTLTCTITGLANGTTYYVDATASNIASVGAAWAPRTSATLAPGAPMAPQSITASAADSSAAVAWTAPLSDGGSAITSYTAQVWEASSGGTTPIKTCQPSPLTGLTCTLTGLTNGTPYYVDVFATNSIGPGALPLARTPVTPAVPAAPPSGGGSSGGSSSSSSSTDTAGGGGGSIWTVKEVRPAFGPVSGGSTVLVLGWGFTGATGVSVGGTLAPSFKFINDATLEIVTPPGALGVQELRVWVPNGSVPATFQYIDAPAAAPEAPSPPAAAPTPTIPVASPAGTPVGPATSPIVRPTTALAGQTAVTSVGRAAGTPRTAPIVTGATGDAFKLSVIGLPKSSKASAQIRIGGRYYSLGTVRTTARGAAVLPAFSAQRAGTYLVKVVPTGGKARYIKVVVR